MKSRKRPKTRTRSVTAKVTAEEEARLKESAAQVGVTLSEWARRSLLGSAQVSSEGRLLLNELMAFRMALLNIQAALLATGDLTPEQMTGIVEAAEKSKFSAAEKRIQAHVLELRNALPGTP